MTLRRVAKKSRSGWPACRRVAGVCRGRAAAGRAGADGPGPDGGLSRLAAGIAAGHPSGQRAADGRRFPQQGPADPRRGRRSLSSNARQLRDLVVGVFDGRPVFPQGRRPASRTGRRKSTATCATAGGRPGGSRSTSSSPARLLGGKLSRERGGYRECTCDRETGVQVLAAASPLDRPSLRSPRKKGSNAVWVANAVLREAEKLRETIVPERHGTGRHPQLRPDGQREGQRTGRGLGRGHPDRRGAV